MRKVTVEPMPTWMLKVRPDLRHIAPPPFEGYTATPQERALARKLFAGLDDESKAWHRESNPDLFKGCD